MINHRQNYRFEMIAPCPFDMMVANLFEMTMALSSKWWIDRLFEMTMVSLRNDGLPVTSRWLMMFSSKVWWLSLRYEDDVLFERWDWMPSAAFETTVIFLVIEERCCVRSCLYSKGQFISKNDRTFLAMIVDFEWTINRQKLSKSYHLIKDR